MLITGDERKDGELDTPAGRETTDPPNNRIKQKVTVVHLNELARDTDNAKGLDNAIVGNFGTEQLFINVTKIS